MKRIYAKLRPLTAIHHFSLIGLLLLLSLNVSAQTDTSHYSEAFQTERSYRIYLPSDYDLESTKEYPVIYYFHGWGGRYKWDIYSLNDDPEYPGNGRTEPPYVMEWRDYAQAHDVIIVTWDGYEPNLHPGNDYREGIPFGGCDPYDFPRAHDKTIKHWGWDFKMYFRELVAHVDSSFRTIDDRDHRAVTGLSMGGLSSIYISGQNKDLVGSVSAFCPADNEPQYGPKGHLAVFTNLEMYRSLKGLPMRLSANDGDWLYDHDIQMKRIFEGAGFEDFDFHLADFPDHWTADADLQLDFHMAEFQKIHKRPDDWSHVVPSYKSFDQWGYSFSVERTNPALTILENMSIRHMRIFSRKFIPDGPIVQEESIHVSSDDIYTPASSYSLRMYNLSDESFSSKEIVSDANGRLEFDLPGGGNIVGIGGPGIENGADIRLINNELKDYLYFEANRPYSLGFNLVNIGNENAGQVSVKAISDHPHIVFTDDEFTHSGISASGALKIDSMFQFSFNSYEDETLAGNILLEISVNGVVSDTQKLVFFATPESPYLTNSDVILLDGKTEQNVRLFNQGSNSVSVKSLSGGSGNGNGIPEAGEELLLYIRLPQGLSSKDINTFHKTYLISDAGDPYISVDRLLYEEKHNQAATTGIYTYLTVSDSVPKDHEFDLWFRVESLYNDPNVAASRAKLYRFKYDYRRVKLSGNTFAIDTATDGHGAIKLSPEGGPYLAGASVVLSAVPDDGYKFDSWGGDLSGSSNPDTLIMDGDKSVTASFLELMPLIAHWQMNETSGTIASDISGNNFDLSLVNTDDSNWQNDPVMGGNLLLDGLEEYGELGFVESNVFHLSQFSNTAFIKMEVGSISTWNRILGFTDAYGFNVNEDGKLGLWNYFGSDWHGSYADHPSLADGLWHHVALTHDDTSGNLLYLDGELVLTQNWDEGSGGNAIVYPGRYPLRLGVVDLKGLNRFPGNLKDVRVYSTMLSQSDIRDIIDNLTSVTDKAVADNQIWSVYPNPVTNNLTVAYTLQKTSNVKVSVFNMLGEEVRVLVDGNQQAGTYSETYMLNDQSGEGLSAGAYVIKSSVDADLLDARTLMIVNND